MCLRIPAVPLHLHVHVPTYCTYFLRRGLKRKTNISLPIWSMMRPIVVLSFSCPSVGSIYLSYFSSKPICSMMIVIISIIINRSGQKKGLVAAAPGGGGKIAHSKKKVTMGGKSETRGKGSGKLTRATRTRHSFGQKVSLFSLRLSRFPMPYSRTVQEKKVSYLC